jgi:hypothetical protein
MEVAGKQPFTDVSRLELRRIPLENTEGGSILIETPLDEFFDLLEGGFGIGALASDAKLRSLAGGEHHKAHDAFAVDLFAVPFHPNIAFVTVADLDEHG